MANPSDLARRAAEAEAAPSADSQGDAHHGQPQRDLWPHDFGRDGVTGLVTVERAMRARDVSRPSPADLLTAADVVEDLLARVDGRPRSAQHGRPQPPKSS